MWGRRNVRISNKKLLNCSDSLNDDLLLTMEFQQLDPSPHHMSKKPSTTSVPIQIARLGKPTAFQDTHREDGTGPGLLPRAIVVCVSVWPRHCFVFVCVFLCVWAFYWYICVCVCTIGYGRNRFFNEMPPSLDIKPQRRITSSNS